MSDVAQAPPTDHLGDRVLLVTGAASGFGRIVTERSAARGARVVAVDINEAALDEATGAISEALAQIPGAGEVLGVPADVTRRAAMATAAEQAIARFGRIDVLVNNAGVMPLAFFADHAVAAEAWERCIDINLKGVLNGIFAVHDAMIEAGRGQIINVSSIYGNYPVRGAAVYGATKAAVNFISEALRQESRGRIKVTTIRPTGVPGTGLGAGVLNPEAIGGVLGGETPAFMEKLGQVFGEQPPEALVSPDSMAYCALAPELLAEQILFAIDQPWGVSISDLTVRASGDDYMI